MKILVVDKSIFGKTLTDANNAFVRHLEFWHGGNNQIDILGKVDEDITKRLKGKINIIKLSRWISIFYLFYAYIHLIFKSKKYDLVIEVWDGKPNLLFVINKKRSLIAIFSRDFRTILPGRIIRFVYGNIRFLVNSYQVREKLLNIGFKSNLIKLFPDGVGPPFNKMKSGETKIGRKQKILIICGKDYDNAVSLISLIERRILDWKFVILTDKRYITKLKKSYRESGLTSGFKTIPFSPLALERNLLNSKFLLITKDVKKVSEYVSEAFSKNTPVVLEGSIRDIDEKRVRDLILNFDNQMDLTGKIIYLTKNISEYEKLQSKIIKVSSGMTWDEVGHHSLKFIESL